MKEIAIPSSNELERSIDSYSQPLANYLRSVGLPTENVLAPKEEIKNVIASLADALSILSLDERAKADYLSKFTVAISVGLFDGALNYLWNETVKALRNLVLKTDLEYFYSVAEKVSSRYKTFSSPEDLDQISEYDLLEVCRRIGLISDINFKRLENVNYMRNHASAAHPNENEIDGFEMLGWLRVCLRHAITAEPDQSVITTKRLLENIRTAAIPANDFPVIGVDIAKQPQERIDDLLWTLFGMFTDPQQAAIAKSNIKNLVKYIWPAGSEDRKYEIGAKYGVFRKNAEIARKDAAQEFLVIVDGQSYKDEDSLAGELIEKLEDLRQVHFGWYNFYNEYPHAKVLGNSLPPSGIVPRAVRPLWVKVISICYVGNGLGYREGVDEGALPYYKKYVENFSEAEVVEFLHLMGDAEFKTVLDRRKPDQRVRELAKMLKPKHTDIYVQRAFDQIINAPANTLYGLYDTKNYKEVLKNIPKH